SRPWLKDDAEAFRLLGMALQEVRFTRGASVEWEHFAAGGPDHSLRAAELAKTGKPLPAWNIAEAPPELRAFLRVNRNRWNVGEQAERWNQLLDRWAEEPENWRIDLPLSLDGIWRISAGDLPELRVRGDSGATAARVRWWALRPTSACYNLMPGFGPGKGFTREAVPWVREERGFLGEMTDGALASDVWGKELSNGWGRVRIEAEVETADGWIPTPVAELRIGEGTGFRRGLSEQFGIPYAFGIGSVRADGVDGPDVGWGNDCANYLIAAWRQTGLALPWGNPAQLRARLEPFAENVAIADGPVPLPSPNEDVIIDFGNHVAALWKDNTPLGKLDVSDEVVHHLGGFPEKLPLGKLASGRPPFAIRTMPRKIACRLRIGGDVVLTDPPDTAAKNTPTADLTVVNLEGVPARDGRDASPRRPSIEIRGASDAALPNFISAAFLAPQRSIRYDFSFPPDNLAWLKAKGIAAVSLANNHATDAGPLALTKSADYLTNEGIGSFGTIRNNVIQPWTAERNGVRLAFFGASCFSSDQNDNVR
ncbi:MAG: CapA family protein, partial [Verrucomicrobiota bacterium]